MSNPYINSKFFSRLEAQSLKLKNDLNGFFDGKHQTNKYGHTVEFADYREYQLGDDLRRIDWNLYSRFEKHYIKLFTDERQMHVQIYLDCSASMGKEIIKKGEYAVAMTAGLGFLAVNNMDKLSIKLIKNKNVDNLNGVIVGKQSFFREMKVLENVKFEGDSYISDAIINNGKTTGKDGLCVIISDFLTSNDWKKAVDYLCFQGKQVMLVQVLAKEEAEPKYNGRLHIVDSETDDIEDSRNLKLNINNGFLDAYELALTNIKKDIKEFCKSRRVGYTYICTDTPVEKAIFQQLLKVGVLE